MIIKTEYGEGELIDIHVSELGFTMIKLYFAESKNYITFNVGKIKLEISKNENDENHLNIGYSQQTQGNYQ